MKVIYQLRQEMRETLGQPVQDIVRVIGSDELIPELSGKQVISIGDVCSRELREKGIDTILEVVDGKTQRGDEKEWEFSDRRVVKVENPQETITRELWEAIGSSIIWATTKDQRTTILVDGEEDLASLAAIMLAPRGTIVIYGLPDRGVALVAVNKASRALVTKVLHQMKVEE